MLCSWDETGFVVSGVQYPGALLIYDNVTLCWKPSTLGDVTADTCAPRAKLAQPPLHLPSARYLSQHVRTAVRRRLAPLLLFKKRPELLILGCGKKLARPPPELTKARSFSHAVLHAWLRCACCLRDV